LSIYELRDKLFSDIVVRVDGVYHFKTFVAGWVTSDDYIEVRSPIDMSVIGRVPKLRWEVVDKALDIVYEVGRWRVRDIPGWARLDLLERLAGLIEQHKEDLVETLIINAGKTRSQALGEVNASVDRLRRADLDARKIYGDYMPGDWDQTTTETEAIVRREPFGVVLAIVPFNYPLFDTVNKFAYSFVAGNAILVKPSSLDPLPVLLFAKLAEEAGVPKEAFAVLTIPGQESDKLVSDWRISVVSFTGSSKTGKSVLSKAGIKQFIMELGGGDPAIVLEDADIDLAAERIALGIYSYAGQRCDAVKLILAEESVYGELKKRVAANLAKVVVGDPRDEKTVMGPLIEPKAVEEMLEAVKEAVERGGKVVYGGRRLGLTYVEPTLVEFHDKDTLKELRLFKEEIFAPVALITSFKELDEAIRIANSRRYGLDAAVFSYNIDKIRKLIRFLEFGAIYVNDMPRHGVGYYPFGGLKESGLGREGIGYSVEYVTTYKTIIYNYRGRGVWRYVT